MIVLFTWWMGISTILLVYVKSYLQSWLRPIYIVIYTNIFNCTIFYNNDEWTVTEAFHCMLNLHILYSAISLSIFFLLEQLTSWANMSCVYHLLWLTPCDCFIIINLYRFTYTYFYLNFTIYQMTNSYLNTVFIRSICSFNASLYIWMSEIHVTNLMMFTAS